MQAVPSIGVSALARPLRRAIGVASWAVLEDLLLDARSNEPGALVAATNVRRVAAHLGVSKDTAARALTRLFDAGVVSRVDCCRAGRGLFPSAAYSINVSQLVGVTVDDATTDPSPRTGGPRPAKPARRPIGPAQSSLFDDPVTDGR